MCSSDLSAAAAGFAVLGFAGGFWPILAVVALASASFTSIYPLADAYALKGLAARGRSYGSVRLWGSGGFIVGSLGGGFVVDLVRPTDLIWLIAAGALVMALISAWLVPLDAPPAASSHPGATFRFLRSPAFLTVAAAAALIQASHALFYGFSTLDWAAAGLGGGTIGALWAIGVFAEIVMFAVSDRFPPALTPAMLLTLGATGAVVRWGAMALDPPFVLLPVLQCLHGLSFAATHLGSVQFLARAAPDHFAASAQGYLTLVLGTAMAAFMSLSGWLYGAYGTHGYAAMAAAAFVGGLLALAAQRLWGRPLVPPI